METDEVHRGLPFQLQFDKPLASQIKIAEWNPEKDILAMVTENSKIMLHRFNWQRLWTISPGKIITSLCWRPDGKAIAAGLEDGTVSLYDVENGKLLRSVKSHTAAVVCLHWEEDSHLIGRESGSVLAYEDRTSRFLPPAPVAPQMAGIVSGDTGFVDDSEDSFRELSNSPQQRFNILCSGDKDGSICFSIFGIFSIAKVNIHNLNVCTPCMDREATYRLLNASIYKVALSKDLCRLIVMCSGEVVESCLAEPRERQISEHLSVGLHSIVLDTSIFWKRKNELHQIAQQASNIEDLVEVIRISLSIMCKQWSDVMKSFHEKFNSLSTLIIDNGLDSSPQEEFLSLLCGGRTSPPIHQFLVNSLTEVGVKRLSNAISNAGKELQLIVLDHIQPAAEIIGFRMGELRGLSRWRARFKGIGLEESLTNDATEKAGMFLVQVERFMSVLSAVVQQFSNFFSWLLKSIKLLMSEPSDQLPPYNSEHVIVFLKYLYDQDPVRQLLELSEVDHSIEINLETMQRVKELVQFGGFSDRNYLRRTLAKEFQHMESSFKDAFLMPFTTISKKIICEDFVPLFPLPSSRIPGSINVPTSVSYYKDDSEATSSCEGYQVTHIDYISFGICDDSMSDNLNYIGIARGFTPDHNSLQKGYISMEAVLLGVPEGYDCVDLSLYKDSQIVLLLNERNTGSESSGNAHMMILRTSDLPFVPISKSSHLDCWKLQELKDSVHDLHMEYEKVRNIPHAVVAPLAVSASRGVACVFAAKKRALVYILDEDEDEDEDEDDE